MNTILLLSDAAIIAIAGVFSGLIATIGGIIIAKINNVKTQLDGRLTQLIELNSVAKKAEGKEEGKEEARVHQIEKEDKDFIRSAAIIPVIPVTAIETKAEPVKVTIVEQKEEIPVTLKKDETKK